MAHLTEYDFVHQDAHRSHDWSILIDPAESRSKWDGHLGWGLLWSQVDEAPPPQHMFLIGDEKIHSAATS